MRGLQLTCILITTALLIVACAKEGGIAEARVHCDLFQGDLYDDNQTNDRDSIIRFMQGTWKVDSMVCSLRADTCDDDISFLSPYTVSFIEKTLEVQSTGSNTLRSTFDFVPGTFPGFYKIKIQASPSELGHLWGYLQGDVIICNDDLVFSTSVNDGIDVYYREED